jgi:hypothetical protein
VLLNQKRKVQGSSKPYALGISHRVTQEAPSVETSVQIHDSTLEPIVTSHFRSFLPTRCLLHFISLTRSVLSIKVISNQRRLSAKDTLSLSFSSLSQPRNITHLSVLRTS